MASDHDGVRCEACDAGLRLADGIHYDDALGGWTWGVCRKEVERSREERPATTTVKFRITHPSRFAYFVEVHYAELPKAWIPISMHFTLWGARRALRRQWARIKPYSAVVQDIKDRTQHAVIEEHTLTGRG